MNKHAEAEVVPSSSLVEVKVEVKVGVEVGVRSKLYQQVKRMGVTK